jgi:lipoprotein-anchoring transpeptidase ErfK/SrfK
VHSGNLQRVDHAHLHLHMLEQVPETGCLGEVTVAYTDSFRHTGRSTWLPLYRLYYQSVHWITGIHSGPDNRPWYRITDDLLHVHFYTPAVHLRPLKAGELAPISPDIAEEQKRIEINLETQTLTAFEGQRVVLQTKVSTGIPTKGESPNGIPTDTPRGRFHVQTKMPSRHMGDGELTSDIEAYELLGVPWVCLFHVDGLALHGTYWHNNFGRRMSHGCVNLRNRDALWLYRWTTPIASHQDWFSRGLGTQIDIL